MELPTTYLVPILQLSKQPHSVDLPTLLRTSLQYLRTLYCPPVRGTRKIQARSGSTPLVSTTANAITEALDSLRADAFERAYAIRWLTALVARIAMIIPEDNEDDNESGDSPSVQTHRIVEEAAALLAACAGTSAAGIIEREFEFPLLESRKVRVTIRDTPLENGDYESVGKQTWGGACVLAEMIAEDPARFWGNVGRRRGGSGPFRVLELGAGTGLVGLTVWATLGALLKNDTANGGVGPCAEVVLTDFHDAVLENLEHNIRANAGSTPQDNATATNPSSTQSITLTQQKLDWSLFAQLPHTNGSMSEGFDVVVGADIIYEAEHARWIRECLIRLLKPGAEFHLVIPLRKTHAVECETVERVFGLERELGILGRERIRCRGDGDDVVEYSYYRIGWC